ncbi:MULTISPECIES: atypical membrane-integrating protein (Mistic protein) [Bacillaceae]|uniref:atypical membrane-integrating protein (Mistic protein) n=1 Tax=Bacillaceae TaxID=186817 RepID=UPI000C76B3E7|nr:MULTISPECIES: atypical membrane-integrating protein (Mistic protein) [Bacillaceae]PLR66078.1 atypical membrane-integrating protein (Mistic protein) [Bacillus sp. UMB0893]QNG60696.1 atypical membrane-integrating protein (Mistic protein) [Bacillus sp. PAMC26568]
MKLTDKEKSALSEAIDKMNEGLDVFIQFYNDAEEDKPIIEFTEDTVSAIEKAMDAYGKEAVAAKINAIIREVLSFLPGEK